ncbi:hypothetical protein Glove_278g44 [Diversispora epigaea]|uniref:Uncharacterized protein n=1 Tax=Diversispora epigaea TaxID=1348612 RepID=A0A397I699_9GLOM|nr:hypothetical protein Glove_278g44 [Diversispora epigaea]
MTNINLDCLIIPDGVLIGVSRKKVILTINASEEATYQTNKKKRTADQAFGVIILILYGIVSITHQPVRDRGSKNLVLDSRVQVIQPKIRLFFQTCKFR